jgi:hypothetical protein
MTALAIVCGVYALATIFQIWYFTNGHREREEEARLERRELTDRIMALSSKPESLVSLSRNEEVEGEVTYVGTEPEWHSEEE